MNNQSRETADIEQKLKPLYEIDPEGNFINRLEKDLLQKGQTVPHAWMARRLQSSRRFAFAGFAILLLAALFFATPQGRAWAQEVFHFFRHAESDILPLQPWQMTAIADYYQKTSTPIIETVTPDPESGFVFNLSVEAAGQKAGFDVMEPTWVPEVLSFGGASYEPDHNIVRIFYYHKQYPDIGNGLVLREERFQTADDCSLCGVVGASEPIESVMIGDTAGEYIIGVWTLTDNGPVWESTPYLKTLRWQENGLAFELQYMGVPETLDEISKDEMIAIAESLR